MNEVEAIKSMRNLDDVISITESEHESVRLSISALEKQIPKKPKTTPYNYHCCDCGEALGANVNKRWTNFCPHCGSAIDWSVEE